MYKLVYVYISINIVHMNVTGYIVSTAYSNVPRLKANLSLELS